MLSIFTLALAANESREVAVTGEYFEIRNALFPIALIELMDRTGALISRLENPEQSDFVKPGLYETVRITNGATAQTIKHFYGSGDAGSRRTSGLVKVEGVVGISGNVSVIDNAKALTLLDQAFFSTALATPVAAQFSFNQLHNPANSGKNLILSSVQLSSSAAGVIAAGVANVALLTDRPFARSKKSPSIASLGSRMKIGNSAAVPSVGFIELFVPYVVANQTITIEFKEPIVITPGFAFEAYNATVAQDLRMSVQFVEEAI